MVPDHSLPRIDACAGLYLDVWDLFGDRPFEPDDVARRLVEHERDVSHITGPDEPQSHLDLLVAYGLLERDDSRYRVRCPPGESVDEWQRDLRPHLEAVYQRVDRLKRRRTGGVHDECEDTGGSVRRKGEVYVATDVDEDTRFPEVAAKVTESVTKHSDATGVALRSPAALAGAVQRLADRLCDAEAMADIDCPRFEKVSSDVVGEHKDDLEYRLYLQPTN